MLYIYRYMRANTLSVCVNMFERMCKYIYICVCVWLFVYAWICSHMFNVYICLRTWQLTCPCNLTFFLNTSHHCSHAVAYPWNFISCHTVWQWDRSIYLTCNLIQPSPIYVTHMLHVLNIYLHLVYFRRKCSRIFHTRRGGVNCLFGGLVRAPIRTPTSIF